MSDQPIENLTLREQLRDAERLGRELADHLERGFAPKAGALAKLIRPKTGGEWNHDVADKTLHHTVQQVLDSHRFTATLMKRFRGLLKAIDESVSEITR